jgi:hypothetical protein
MSKWTLRRRFHVAAQFTYSVDIRMANTSVLDIDHDIAGSWGTTSDLSRFQRSTRCRGPIALDFGRGGEIGHLSKSLQSSLQCKLTCEIPGCPEQSQDDAHGVCKVELS